MKKKKAVVKKKVFKPGKGVAGVKKKLATAVKKAIAPPLPKDKLKWKKNQIGPKSKRFNEKAPTLKKITVPPIPTKEYNPFGFVDTEDVELPETYILFAKYYVEQGCQNGSKAAIRAGYSENSAKTQASRMLTHDNLLAYIDQLKKNIGLVIDVSAYDIAREYKKIGFINPKVFYNVDGSTKNIHDIPDDATAAIASIEVEELFENMGKGVGNIQVGVIKKIKLHSKTTGLDSLAKMIGAEGITKVAQVNKDGDDVPQTLSDKHVVAMLVEIRKAAGIKKQ